MIKNQISYWNNFYKKVGSHKSPTNFAKFILKSKILKKKTTLFDLGCGNGRDTIFFIKNKINCIGFDQSKLVIKKNKLENYKYKKNFYVKDFSKINFDKFVTKKFSLYLRFSFHSINQHQEDNFFKNLYKSSKLEFVFIEARTIFDPFYGKGTMVGNNAFISDHYRRFLDPEILKKKLSKKFDILFFKLGKNFAKFKNENPKVLRLCLKKR